MALRWCSILKAHSCPLRLALWDRTQPTWRSCSRSRGADRCWSVGLSSRGGMAALLARNRYSRRTRSRVGHVHGSERPIKIRECACSHQRRPSAVPRVRRLWPGGRSMPLTLAMRDGPLPRPSQCITDYRMIGSGGFCRASRASHEPNRSGVSPAAFELRDAILAVMRKAFAAVSSRSPDDWRAIQLAEGTTLSFRALSDGRVGRLHSFTET